MCDDAEPSAARARSQGASPPRFIVAADDLFRPALHIGHDAGGHFTSRCDMHMLAEYVARIDA